MKLDITPIGTGNAFTKLGFETSYLIRSGKTELLLDCGVTASRALHALDMSLWNTPLGEVRHVYLSHGHIDHIGGLVELGVLSYLKELPKPRIYGHTEFISPLWDATLSSFLGCYVDLKGKPQHATSATFFDWQPISHTIDHSNESLQIQDLTIRLVPVPHIPGMTCHGLIINDRVLITTDTTFQPELLERIANKFGLEAIFHDCSFDAPYGYVHATYAELLSLPNDLRELLLLTHYEDSAIGKQDSEITLAEPGKSYVFP